MGAFWIIRTTLLTSVLAISLAVIGLSAFYLSKFNTAGVPPLLDGSLPAWAILSLVTAGGSLLLVTPMVTIDFVRTGAITSHVRTELIAFSVLSILWLAAAADATAGFSLGFLTKAGLPKTCMGVDDFITDIEALAFADPGQYGFLLDYNLKPFGTMCRSHQAVQALAFVSWLFLTGYAATLLVSARIAKYRGHTSIWTSTVRDTQFLNHRGGQTATIDLNVPRAASEEGYYEPSHSLKAEEL